MCMTCDEQAAEFEALAARPEAGDAVVQAMARLQNEARDAGLPATAREVVTLALQLSDRTGKARESVACPTCGRRYHRSWPNHVDARGYPCPGHARVEEVPC